ncbi:inner membrane protein [Chitinivorax tropicus]|uniref:Inner membrane protein n=1 Tax=Chitinivorax tropicus TaxID=714531 RepID=A0A840MMC2_9PROT|nr:metal-dependent hydrolase [Chitinivorax tropicus]MBB5017862.1 inner membrane protein [Chitinivorax tropicus]
MPTILTHAVVPCAIGLACGRAILPRRLVALGMLAAMLPDLDVLAFKFGIPYAHAMGHRGMTHSLAFAALAGLLAGLCGKPLHARFPIASLFIFFSMASHGLLDTLTTGGLGIALLWPWSDQRFFAPVQMIRVSPIGLSRFLSERGLIVLWSEFRWVWLPCMGFALGIACWRRHRAICHEPDHHR